MDVAIFLGSNSDREYIEETQKILSDFNVSFETIVCSAHRSPEKLVSEITRVENLGVKVFVAMAGYAAHLPGTIAARTTKPVLGVPLPSSELQGIDALLSVVQMPGGVPVATLGIGKSGAKNAALLAIQILSLSSQELLDQWKKYKEALSKG